ncbi:MAG TPA: efflux RND transporter periplasmic adaptor subunit [Chthonomonadaceae bacterium]|nr:efflux RND transporter periplasmic adaptor subunit [Chthonomonadaceae bacterium]
MAALLEAAPREEEKPQQTHVEEDFAPQDERETPEPKRPARPFARVMIVAVLGILLFAAGAWGWRAYQFGQAHVDTDDAYVTGDLVNISPIISGTLDSLNVEEGDVVHKGQLIARLSDSGPHATLQQAQAALEAAQSQIPEAERSLEYTTLATDAAIQHAQAAIAAQNAKTSGAQQQVALSSDTVRNQVEQAERQVDQAKAQAAQAEAQAVQADAQVKTAEVGVQSFQQAVQTAQNAARAAEAGVVAANANAERAGKDEVRYAQLVKQEAVTQQQYETAHAAAESAQAQLHAAQEQAAQAKSEVERARVNVEQAQAQQEAARKQALATHKQADVARDQVNVALAGLNLAKSNGMQTRIQQSNVANNVQQGGQAQADLLNAQAGREQIAMRRKQIDIYKAQVAQASAAVKNAQVTLDDTAIYAPCDGVVVKKTANVGMALAPGQTIVTITQGNRVWVSGNFKETQLTHVRPGQSVELKVDSFPNLTFEGQVNSVNRATGAATSLLPPDNATGNFTKVVQRIPVKIFFVPSNRGAGYATQQDLDLLRQGMSVTATIDTAHGGK